MNKSEDLTAPEAGRLKSIYKDRKRQDPSLTQEKLADAFGWSSQSVVSQYMNGKIPLNLPALIKFASALHFELADVSPRLASIISVEEANQASLDAPIAPPSPSNQKSAGMTAKPRPLSGYALNPIEVWDDELLLGEDEVELPFFKEVELSAGKGSAVMLEEYGRKLRFGKRTLARKNIDPLSAACVPVAGNSMEPVLPHGSTVGINLAATAVQDGKMYAVDHDGQLRVKLLYQLPNHGLRLRSYNTDEHPDERYTGDYVEEHIRIIGQVWWYSVLL